MPAWALTGELAHSAGQVGDWPPGGGTLEPRLEGRLVEFGRWMGAGASQGVRVLERGGEQW